MIFGKKIKELREEHGLLQRQLSAALEIDTPMYSKIEKELLTIWLSDKVLDTVENEEEIKSDAIIYAQNKINSQL